MGIHLTTLVETNVVSCVTSLILHFSLIRESLPPELVLQCSFIFVSNRNSCFEILEIVEIRYIY